MPAPFKKVSLEQFAGILERFEFTRAINAVHMHHTWRPNHQQFKGHDSIVAMWRYHTEHNGWSDIAQHITIDPQGEIWLGRNWNMSPASATGHNGNAKAGPFMFEMIGDFDAGQDRFEGAQRDTALSVIAMVQRLFDLAPGSLKFHSAMSDKSCPGSAIDYQQTLEGVRQQRARLEAQRGVSRAVAPPFQADAYENAQVIDEALGDLARTPLDQRAEFDADACSHHPQQAWSRQADRDAERGATLTPVQAQGLRPHLVNLSMGAFSSGGEWTTTRADVDAIFTDHLPRALQAARDRGQPLRLVFQAHGGLNNEATGLAIAQKSVGWWIANGVYPIYFTWETGLFETIGQLLKRAAGEGARDLADYTSDPVVQETVRLLQAPKIWGGMKLSAQLASSPPTMGQSHQAQDGTEGGAYYVAQQLAAFCRANRDEVEVHAVGHSAGSIFHSWFIPCALELGVPVFRSLHLMAPAVRVDLFKEKLAALVGPHQGIDDLTLYTMKEDLEADDSCAKVYRKSLLYLIFHALEPQRKTPILGLEESLRADHELSRMFGLDGGASRAEVIWSRTSARQGRSASNATSHGGFDDDPSTMGSIARRILRRADHDSIVEYVSSAADARAMEWNAGEQDADMAQELGLEARPDTTPHGPIVIPERQQSTRRALCVGINDYPTAPLTGCVADVEVWNSTLSAAGFAVTRLLNGRATRAAIVDMLEKMVATSRRGDVLVFQYSGHGTQVPDLDGDEARGDSPGLDEAICPFDFASGALLIDDDIGRIFAKLPDGVNLTCFMDCCHSGTISRFAMGSNASTRPRDGSEHMRFIPAGTQLIAAHRRYREAMAPQATVARGEAPLREVVFSACLSHEVAWESRGQGEFTVRANEVLAKGMEGMTNGQFAAAVSAAFGPAARQHAKLYGSSAAESRMLLQPLDAAPAVAESVQPVAALPVVPPPPDMAQLVQLMQNLQELLQQNLAPPANAKYKPGRKTGLQHTPSASLQQSGHKNR
jgi:hypothetical protein